MIHRFAGAAAPASPTNPVVEVETAPNANAGLLGDPDSFVKIVRLLRGLIAMRKGY